MIDSQVALIQAFPVMMNLPRRAPLQQPAPCIAPAHGGRQRRALAERRGASRRRHGLRVTKAVVAVVIVCAREQTGAAAQLRLLPLRLPVGRGVRRLLLMG